MMIHGAVVGACAARANGFGDHRLHSGSIGGRAPSPNLSTPRRAGPTTAMTLGMPHSSAFTASWNRSSLATAAAMGRAAAHSSPSNHNETMKNSIQTLRSSPTSVLDTMPFDGGGGGIYDLPYGGIDSSLSAACLNSRYHPRPNADYSSIHYHATPTADYRDPHEVPFGIVTNETRAPPILSAACLPCKPGHTTQTPVSTPPRIEDVVKFDSRGRRSGNHGPNISAGDDGAPPPPSGGGGGGSQPTPQNLRDNPERLAKVKTEMCHYYENGGAKNCPWGDNCNYAHGKHELKFRYTTLYLMESSGQIVNAKTYLARPCMTWVSTGACPFGRRCPGIHDPSISAPLECPSWLPAATAKTNAQIIVDQHAAHRDSAVHQENPLIAQSIWENCRPSRRGQHEDRSVNGTDHNAMKSVFDIEQEWTDTYALVCNAGVPIFTGGINRVNAPVTKVSQLQKLCIAFMMRSGDGMFQREGASSELHRDYIFAPTHSLHSELCMILQARYFLLLDVSFTSAAEVSLEDVVKEISPEEYKSRTTPWSATGHSFDPSRCVSAHEVAFAPKGDHNANVSIWFDGAPIRLEQSQIKRSRRLKQKKKAHIRNDHNRPNSNGALISRTSSVDFPTSPPEIDPFVPMLPSEDNDESHRLVLDIIDHRIKSMILYGCSSMDEEQAKSLSMRMKHLQEVFMCMTMFHEKWTWPKREGMGHVSITTKAPPGNVMPYIPLKSNGKSPCLHTWHAFVKNIGMVNKHADHSSVDDDTKRLDTFLSIDGSNPRTKQGGKARLPHILSSVWWNAGAGNCPKTDGTWKEILLGLPENGKWETAKRLHDKNTTMNDARNMPLSTIPFVKP